MLNLLVQKNYAQSIYNCNSIYLFQRNQNPNLPGSQFLQLIEGNDEGQKQSQGTRKAHGEGNDVSAS
jgi:hypothetical protein